MCCKITHHWWLIFRIFRLDMKPYKIKANTYYTYTHNKCAKHTKCRLFKHNTFLNCILPFLHISTVFLSGHYIIKIRYTCICYNPRYWEIFVWCLLSTSIFIFFFFKKVEGWNEKKSLNLNWYIVCSHFVHTIFTSFP